MPSPEDTVTVVTWNINVGGGDLFSFLDTEFRLSCGNRGPASGEAVVPFVLLLQEVYRRSDQLPIVSSSALIPWTIDPDEDLDIVEFADHCGLSLVYVPSARNGPDNGARPSEDKGNAILSTLPLSAPVAIDLPFEAGRKVAVTADIRITGRPTIRVVSAHLDLAVLTGNQTRARQASGLIEALDLLDGRLPGVSATVVGADLNTWAPDETIPGRDRAGLERLLRYCARPPFALERLEANGYGAPGGERIVYRLPHPAPDGTTALSLTPLEFLERLALLIHPPRIHRHRYHGVLAPNAKLRYQVIALGHEQGRVEESPSGQLGTQSVAGSSGGAPGRRMSSRWASLIARIYDVLPLVCPSCGASMSIIAFITDPVPVRSILSYLDLPTQPPPLSPARAPPQGLFEFDQTGGFDPADPEPIPEFEFDQSLPY